MRRRDFIAVLGGAAAALPLNAPAQERVPEIGYLNFASPATNPTYLSGFRRGLAEGGYVEGQNVAIEYRWADHQPDRLAELAGDLVRRQVSVIAATGGPPAIYAAKAATTTIPIVFTSGDDPVRLGFVTNLARPDGNLTGISFFNAELAAKRLELLRELVPGAARVAVLVNPANAAIAETTLRDLEGAARAMALQIQVLNASTSREISAAFATLGRENRPPKGKGGPRLGSVDKGWCCHERGLNDSESCGARNCDFSRITGTGRIGVSCRPPIAYSRVDTGWHPSAVPSNSNFPASHLGSQLGLIGHFHLRHSADLRRLPRQAVFLPPSPPAKADHRPANIRVRKLWLEASELAASGP